MFYSYIVVTIKPVTKTDRNDFSSRQEIAQTLRHARSTTVRAISFRRTLWSMQIDFLRVTATSTARIRRGEGGNYSANVLNYHMRKREIFAFMHGHVTSLRSSQCTRPFFIFEIRILLSQAPHSIIHQQFIRQFALLILYAF